MTQTPHLLACAMLLCGALVIGCGSSAPTCVHIEDCATLGWSAVDSEDYQTAAAYFEQGCDGQDGAACEGLGELHLVGHGVEPDPVIAVLRFEQACSYGSADGCQNAGVAHLDGVGVAPDANRAAGFFDSACSEGSSAGCFNLGILYLEGRGVPQLDQRAAEQFDRACEDGHLAGCNNLASLVLDGRVPGATLEQAIAPLAQVCQARQGLACYHLGVLYLQQLDFERGAGAFAIACDVGFLPGCNNVGVLLIGGMGVVTDSDRGTEYLRRACEGGRTVACQNLELGLGATLGLEPMNPEP